jgi:hypothetical protein
MPVMVASFLVYAWTSDKKTNVAGPIVALVFGGFSLMSAEDVLCRIASIADIYLRHLRVIYASTLAYLVDANPGRSSSAIACNSFFRGTFAFVASQVALPIRDQLAGLTHLTNRASSEFHRRRRSLYHLFRLARVIVFRVLGSNCEWTGLA